MYFLIGISLLFAFLFAIDVAASLTAMLGWRLLANTASRWGARTRVNVIFLMRVFPLVAATIFISAFVLPAFLIYEPTATDERVGLKLTLISLVSAFGIVAAFGRVFAGWWRTRRLIGEWMGLSEPVEIEGVTIPAFRMRHPFPIIAVVGVLRPRMFVAEQILAELDDAELAASIAHEHGHISNHDNLKRIAMRVCGDFLVLPLGKTLDRAWDAAAESAADEYAARMGGGRCALDLASALIKVGRITPNEKALPMPVGAYLLGSEDQPLAERVDRLLRLADRADTLGGTANSMQNSIWLIPILAVIATLPMALNPNLLSAVHTISEELLAALQ